MSRKKNGEGHTYPFRNGYRTVIKVRGITFSATGKTEAESRRKAKEKVKRSERLNWGANTSSARTTLGEFMTWWLETEHRDEIADTTYRRYQQLATLHILPNLGDTRLVKLTRHEVNYLLDQMKSAGQSLRSAQQARALLSACLNAAIEEDLIGANPVGASRKVKVPRFEIEPLSAAEVTRVIEAAPSTTMKLRLELALYYGLRQGEALGLRWKRIDFEKSAMRITQQVQTVEGTRELVDLKTKSSHRTLPLEESTLALLRSQKAEVASLRLAAGAKWIDTGLVFPNKVGNPLASRWDYEQWHRALEAAGLEKRRLHDARHTCATLLLEQGVDIEVIRYWLGHSNVQLTSDTYIHLTDKTTLSGIDAVKRLKQNPQNHVA